MAIGATPLQVCSAARRCAGLSLGLTAALLALTGCGTAHHASSQSAASPSQTSTGASASRVAVGRAAPRLPSYPVAFASRVQQPGPAFRPVVLLRGRAAAWIARRSEVTMLRFDQRVVRLALHAGLLDPGASGWRYGALVHGTELHRLVAAFNGGFRLNVGAGGYQSQGRTEVALAPGIGSVVTYTDGTTDIGAWQSGVPAAGRTVSSVRQNLHLLIDGGVPDATVSGCALSCWGATLGGGVDVARSGLGITAGGELVYAGGESLSPQQLAEAMAGAGVQRAVELDINPQWVAAYVYGHHGSGGPTIMPVVPGQVGVGGFFLQPYSRDFFAIIARR